MNGQNPQRLYLHRILAQGAERLGITLIEGAEENAVFGWRDRTIGAPVRRDNERMWLRATGEHRDWAATEHWSGNQDAAFLTDLPKPALLARTEWLEGDVINCAELMTFISDPVCSPTPDLKRMLTLSDTWWHELRQALDTLGRQQTERGTENASRYTSGLRIFFGTRADHLRPAWRTEHQDLQWSNLTAPRLWVLDWESWGRSPVGYGAASLYCHSLLVPQVARRVHRTFADILDTPEGRFAQACVIAHLLQRATDGDYADLILPLHQLADRILTEEF
ncbi:aminoglycoside phosphotransferase [Streptomyces xiamenensis]|uniref:aminoglycoside phosphotransferase n=1 Tax=Streptomyces xiamenensis TaxID=408015 RepID=UPI0036E97973